MTQQCPPTSDTTKPRVGTTQQCPACQPRVSKTPAKPTTSPHDTELPAKSQRNHSCVRHEPARPHFALKVTLIVSQGPSCSSHLTLKFTQCAPQSAPKVNESTLMSKTCQQRSPRVPPRPSKFPQGHLKSPMSLKLNSLDPQDQTRTPGVTSKFAKVPPMSVKVSPEVTHVDLT